MEVEAASTSTLEALDEADELQRRVDRLAPLVTAVAGPSDVTGDRPGRDEIEGRVRRLMAGPDVRPRG